jgi:hypothetical protein
LLDAAAERQASVEALNPEVRAYSRGVRLTALILAIASFIGSPVVFVLGFGFRWFAIPILLFGLSQAGLVFFFSPREAARRRFKGATDLTRLSAEREREPK